MSSPKDGAGSMKRKIKINRCGFNLTASEVPIDKSPIAKMKETTTEAPEGLPPKVARVSKKEAQEAQTKIVDDLFKDFLVQKMAVIEKERENILLDKAKSLEKERENMNKIIQDPAPFKEFLIQKMALIEREREAVEKSREKKEEEKMEEEEKKEESKEISAANIKERKRSKGIERSHKEKDSEKVKKEKEVVSISKDKSNVANRSETDKRSKETINKETDKIAVQGSSKDKKSDPALPEILAKKIAAIEKERREVEKKAIKNAEESCTKSKKHKSHKKDKKKDKEKKRSSRSHSREHRKKRKSKHKSRDKSADRRGSHRDKSRGSDHRSRNRDRSSSDDRGSRHRDRSRSTEHQRHRSRSSEHRSHQRHRSHSNERQSRHRDRSRSNEHRSHHRDRSRSVEHHSYSDNRRKSDHLAASDDGQQHRSSSYDNDSNSTRAKSPKQITCTLRDLIKHTDCKCDREPDDKNICVDNTPVSLKDAVCDNENSTVTVASSNNSEPNINYIKLPDPLPLPLPQVQEAATEIQVTDAKDTEHVAGVTVKTESHEVHSKDPISVVRSLQEKLLDMAAMKLETPAGGSLVSSATIAQRTQAEVTLPAKSELPAPAASAKGSAVVASAAAAPVAAATAGVKEEPRPPKKLGLLKIGLNLGVIKISQTSTELIQSGRRVDPDGKVIENLEDGELDETEDSTMSSDLSSTMSSTLSITDNEMDNTVNQKKKKKKAKLKKKKHKSEKESKRSEKDSKSKSSKKRHSKSRSASRSRSKSRERSRRRSRDRSRSKSTSRDRDRSRRSTRRDTDRYRSRDARGDRWATGGRGYGGTSGGSRYRRRSRSRDRRVSTDVDLRLKIDKAKLREIAIANAYVNMQTGQGPPMTLKPDDIATIKAGGKSVEELTDFCKRIAQKEGDCSSSSGSDLMGRASDEEEGGPFIHHPFKVREAPNIVLNIRNAKQLPILTSAEKMAQSSHLRLTFPVSSGSHHRDNEGEWVPVQKTTSEMVVGAKKAVTAGVAQPAVPALPPPPVLPTASIASGTPSVAALTAPPLPPPPPPPVSIFPDAPMHDINIGAIVSERLSAMRKLQDNPNDVVAIGNMYKAQRQMNEWAASKQLPGQFTGSTGVQVLSQQELSGTDRHKQAWIKKDQFTRAAPVKSGIGMYLLQKMGWKQGEGLGKNKEGSTEPLMLDVKTDRKGLTSTGENVKKNGPAPVIKDLAGKHPVSALVELCTKRRWGSPDFIVVHESGPDHKKNFLYKVVVHGCEYQATLDSANKKLAKAQAATICLQQLGMVPRHPAPSATTIVAAPPPQLQQPLLRPPSLMGGTWATPELPLPTGALKRPLWGQFE